MFFSIPAHVGLMSVCILRVFTLIMAVITKIRSLIIKLREQLFPTFAQLRYAMTFIRVLAAFVSWILPRDNRFYCFIGCRPYLAIWILFVVPRLSPFMIKILIFILQSIIEHVRGVSYCILSPIRSMRALTVKISLARVPCSALNTIIIFKMSRKFYHDGLKPERIWWPWSRFVTWQEGNDVFLRWGWFWQPASTVLAGQGFTKESFMVLLTWLWV